MTTKKSKIYRYWFEANRMTRYGQKAVAFMRAQGFECEERSKTVFVIFAEAKRFKSLLRAVKLLIDGTIGRATLFSCRTANVFELDNRGNRPGRFIKA